LSVKELIEKTRLTDPKVLRILGRVVLGAIFFLIGFNFSHSVFFRENPIFGVKFLAEMLVSLAAAVFGFHTVPIIFSHVQQWFERFIASVVSRIVADFWDQQTKRMQDSRRRSQRRKKQAAKDKKRQEKFKNAVFVDTSVLIDGRILDIVKTGFVDSCLVVPQQVLDELHLISDSGDSLKRNRGRRGLDVLNGLKKSANLEIFKVGGKKKSPKDVDKALVNLAKMYKSKLMTLDFNLSKVARASGIEVLNINELVNAVKTVVLPGESLVILIVQKGKEENQGVGYLEDGTMVVVEGASQKMNKELKVKVSRVIQTPAGRMIFCQL